MQDHEFWDDPLYEPETAGFPSIPKQPTLVLQAPKKVLLTARETFPVVVRRTSTVADERNYPFSQTGILVAVDIDRNTIFADVSSNLDNVVPIPKLAPGQGKAMVITPQVIELRERLRVPWQAATYLVTAIVQDQVSNRERTALVRGETVLEDPAVAEFLAAKRGQIGPLPESPPRGQPLPSYAKMPDSPEIPDDPGIALAVDRVSVVGRAGSRVVLRGAFRVPVHKEDVVPRQPEYLDPASRPRAIVAIHLLFTGSEDATPVVLTVRAPSYDPIDPAAPSGHATGYFAVELLEHAGLGDLAQSYFLYAFSRELMSGPVRFSTVTPDMLPPGAI